jgi:hypothetical protein
MTKLFERRGNKVVMDRIDPRMGVCEFCKKRDDLRPYGPNNENICFDCMKKDEETAKRKFMELFMGAS